MLEQIEQNSYNYLLFSKKNTEHVNISQKLNKMQSSTSQTIYTQQTNHIYQVFVASGNFNCINQRKSCVLCISTFCEVVKSLSMYVCSIVPDIQQLLDQWLHILKILIFLTFTFLTVSVLLNIPFYHHLLNRLPVSIKCRKYLEVHSPLH